MTEGPDETGGGGLFDDLEFDEELEDEWLAEWDEADRGAVDLLRRALADRVGTPAPASLTVGASAVRPRLTEPGGYLTWVREAADLNPAQVPADDAELLIRCTAATMSAVEMSSLPDEEEAMLASLQHADWLGAVVSTVRAGAGGDASPEGLVEAFRSCPEVEDADELDDEDAEYLETAFGILALPWHLLGLTDADDRLTELGEWILPRALARAWSGDFDAPSAGRP